MQRLHLEGTEHVNFKLLCKDPKKRMGSKSDNFDLREHPWLEDIDFDALLQYKLNAPIIPEVNDELDVDNFNAKFTSERPKMTMLSEDMIMELKKYDKMFNGFYYDQISEKEENMIQEVEEVDETEEMTEAKEGFGNYEEPDEDGDTNEEGIN